MGNRAIQAMMRDPRALMRFHQTGRLPSSKPAPTTPLRELIELIPPRLRSRFKGVSLHPKLGFESSMTFRNLSQLYTWLGGNQTIVGNESMPYMHWRNRAFHKRLTIADLVVHCASSPAIDELQRYVPRSIL